MRFAALLSDVFPTVDVDSWGSNVRMQTHAEEVNRLSKAFYAVRVQERNGVQEPVWNSDSDYSDFD